MPRSLVNWGLLLVATLQIAPACTASHARGPAAAAGSGGSQEMHVIPLRPYFGRLRTIDVVIGSKTFLFLLDTGAGLTVLSEQAAEAVGCKPFGRLTGFRAGGERVDFRRCGPMALGIGPNTVVDEVAVFDFSKVLPPELPAVDGALSLKTLEDVPFTLDLARERLIFETVETLAQRVAAAAPLKIRLAREVGGAALTVIVAAAAQPASMWLSLDSGNTDVVLLAPEAAEAMHAGADQGGATSVMLFLNGLAPIEAPARVVPLISDGNLGAEVMEKLVLTFDLAHGQAWAAPPSGPPTGLQRR